MDATAIEVCFSEGALRKQTVCKPHRLRTIAAQEPTPESRRFGISWLVRGAECAKVGSIGLIDEFGLDPIELAAEFRDRMPVVLESALGSLGLWGPEEAFGFCQTSPMDLEVDRTEESWVEKWTTQRHLWPEL